MATPEKASRWAAALGFPLFIAALIAAAVAYRSQLVGLFKSAEAIRAWVSDKGALAALTFAGLQALQVVVFVIPGEIVQVAGGFAFGLWPGTLWSTLGILAGSALNFAVGRTLGRRFVAAVFGQAALERVERATAGGKAKAGFFLLYLIPGIPKDALTYAAGAGGLRFSAFLLVSTLGRLPGIIGSSYMGSASYARAYGPAAIVLAAASTLFIAGLLFRDRLHSLIGRLVERLRRR